MITIKEKWNSFKEKKPDKGASCFIANKAGNDYCVGIYWNDNSGFEYITPIGWGGYEIECDFYDYGYWIEFDIELPSEKKEIEK